VRGAFFRIHATGGRACDNENRRARLPTGRKPQPKYTREFRPVRRRALRFVNDGARPSHYAKPPPHHIPNLPLHIPFDLPPVRA
jgi:hypothetical protein